MKFVKSIFTVCSYRVYLHFDHHLTTTVQTAPQNVGKARCDNQQRAFSCFGGKCAEPTKFTFHRQSIPPCRSSPTRKARGSNPPGRTKSSTLWGAALFVLHGFYGAVKERIRTARAPRFASRGAETPRWGVSRARLGEFLRAHKKAHCNVLLQCAFWFDVILVQNHFSLSGKMILLTKKKISIDTPPFKTVVPML